MLIQVQVLYMSQKSTCEEFFYKSSSKYFSAAVLVDSLCDICARM